MTPILTNSYTTISKLTLVTHTLIVQALEGCSYQKQREELILLQIKLRNKTGVDPLRGTGLHHNPIYYR